MPKLPGSNPPKHRQPFALDALVVDVTLYQVCQPLPLPHHRSLICDAPISWLRSRHRACLITAVTSSNAFAPADISSRQVTLPSNSLKSSVFVTELNAPSTSLTPPDAPIRIGEFFCSAKSSIIPKSMTRSVAWASLLSPENRVTMKLTSFGPTTS